MQVIYAPAGKAKEYANKAANFYRGCKHGCLYCYACDVVHMEKLIFHGDPQPRKNILQQFQKDCEQMRAMGDTGPVLLSFTTDPYQPMELDEKLTQQAINIAHAHGIGIEILTKGPRLASRDFNVLGNHGQDAFAVTLTFDNDEDSRKWEPKADSPEARLWGLRKASEQGIRTWVSCEPVIRPEQTLHMIEESAPYVDFYKVGMWNHDKTGQASQIDWPDFGHRAVELLEKLGKKYLIKKDLAKAMIW